MAKTIEQLQAEARKAGVEVRITQRPKGTGEVVPMPGIRRPPELDEFAPERDDDGTGTDA